MFTLVTHADGAWRGAQGKNLQRLTHRPVLPRTGDPRGRRWANDSDHILASKRHDRGRPSLIRPSFPTEPCEAASGTIDLVTPQRLKLPTLYKSVNETNAIGGRKSRESRSGGRTSFTPQIGGHCPWPQPLCVGFKQIKAAHLRNVPGALSIFFGLRNFSISKIVSDLRSLY